MFRSTLLVSLCVVSAFVASGCGKNLAALTPDQKAIVQDTMGSAGRVQSAAMSKKTGTVGAMIFSRSPLAALSAPSVDQSLLTMEQKLNNCSFNVGGTLGAGAGSSSSSSGTSVTAGDFSMQYSGTSCPISLNLSGKVSGSSSSSATVTIALDYQVNDASFLALNDLDSAHLAGDTTVNASSSSATVDMSLSGKIHSQKRGDIGTTMTVSVAADSSGSMTMTQDLDLVFKDFEADLKIKGDQNSMHYYINSEEVSSTEFAKYMQGV
ncbi:MAG: hypothetical protein ACXVBW_12455, partial [Bdellovibrionota bacterium]